jgi:hypothetical protein
MITKQILFFLNKIIKIKIKFQKNFQTQILFESLKVIEREPA